MPVMSCLPSRVSLCLVALVTLDATHGAASQRQTSPRSFVIVAGDRFGPIRESTTRAELPSLFGTALRNGDVELGEGICTSGTKVFAGTPDEIDIAWKDEQGTSVSFVRTITAGGRWRTARGVRMGTSLSELERLAGRVLTFSGFGWDYGGGLSWTEPGGRLGLRLTMSPGDNQIAATAPGRDAIFGDKLVRSDQALIRRLHVQVDEITQAWGSHASEHDCR
jgi:hypothetical protein